MPTTLDNLTATLLHEEHMQQATLHATGSGEAAWFSARCPSKDSPNEDAAALFVLDEEQTVLVLADGMGGGQAGEKASRAAVEAIGDALQRCDADPAAVRSAILDGIERGNERVQKLAAGAATTLLVVQIVGHSVRCYHVGDSQALVVGQRGKVKLQTISHSPVGFAVEAGHLDHAEALHHEDRHIVSNMVGSAAMRIEIGSVLPLAVCDTVVLGSDGLFDNLHMGEIIERVRKGSTQQAAQRLADEAHRRMTEPHEGEPSKPDDLTVIVYRRVRGH
jgi:serine/threonine protein phosphatase PrpC